MGLKQFSEVQLSQAQMELLKGKSIAIVTAQWNKTVTHKLLSEAIKECNKFGFTKVHTYTVPGSYELILSCKWLVECKRFDAVIALGCVIKGETDHDLYINQAITENLASIQIQSHIPIALGVLTVNNAKQAMERAGGIKGNKGKECVQAVAKMLLLKSEIENF